jgi:hypothetical protein
MTPRLYQPYRLLGSLFTICWNRAFCWASDDVPGGEIGPRHFGPLHLAVDERVEHAPKQKTSIASPSTHDFRVTTPSMTPAAPDQFQPGEL